MGELEALIVRPPPQPPGEDEPVLFEDWMLSWSSPGRVWLTPKWLLRWPPLWKPWPGQASPLLLAGYALFAWASMSYSKAKGYSVLPGLVVSLLFPLFVCSPVALVFLASGPKRKP